jgi:hypothetical protein
MGACINENSPHDPAPLEVGTAVVKAPRQWHAAVRSEGSATRRHLVNIKLFYIECDPVGVEERLRSFPGVALASLV